MPYVAFSGFERVAAGPWEEMAALSRARPGLTLFDEETGKTVDADPRGDTPPPGRGRPPGRPRLGVVAREVTLLPRHWDWLAAQPGGASVTLRKLVEAARRDPAHTRRQRRDAAFRFATAIAGDAPGYEEAMRALYAGPREAFLEQIEAWPPDVRAQLEKMTEDAF